MKNARAACKTPTLRDALAPHWHALIAEHTDRGAQVLELDPGSEEAAGVQSMVRLTDYACEKWPEQTDALREAAIRQIKLICSGCNR